MTDEKNKEHILQDILHLRGVGTIDDGTARQLVSGQTAPTVPPPAGWTLSGPGVSHKIATRGDEFVSSGGRLKQNTAPEQPVSGSADDESRREVTEEEAGLMGHSPFPEPQKDPTQKGKFGIRFDFNSGVRVHVPKGNWLTRLTDIETETVFYAIEGGGFNIASRKKHFIRTRIEIEREGEIVWSHDFNAKKKKVAIVFPAGTLGDTLGWFPYAYRFMQKHECELHVVLARHMREILGPVYPDVHFYDKEEFVADKALLGSLYATYYLGLFFTDEENTWQPSDFRLVGLHRTAGHILDVDPTEIPPRVAVAKPDTRPIAEPYVVVAVQASSACKLWNNPTGWLDTVAYLKSLGYRVICIDQCPVTGKDASWNALPNGVEDETGSRPLSERARWIKYADFFVGLSSGLSWLAWGVGTPVVMISGFTHPSNEFETKYRVFSAHGCNSCWHDVRVPFKHDEYIFCPRHKGTAREFECTRILSSAYVIETIKRLCADYGFVPPKDRKAGTVKSLSGAGKKLSGQKSSGQKPSGKGASTGKKTKATSHVAKELSAQKKISVSGTGT